METKRTGKCINFGECSKADRHEIIELDFTADFVCPECDKDLEEFGNKGGKKSSNKMVIIIIASILLTGAGVGAYFFLFLKGGNPESITLTPQELTLEPGATEKVKAAILPEGTDAEITWMSDNESVATVKNGKVTAVKDGTANVTASIGNDIKATLAVVVAAVAQTQGNPVSQPGEKPKSEDPKPKVNTDSKQTSTQEDLKPPKQGPEIGRVEYAYGVYKGEIKSETPEGQGTMYYTKKTLISKRDKNERYAEAGDYLTGEWHKGEIVNGKLYDKGNNQKESIIVGRVD